MSNPGPIRLIIAVALEVWILCYNQTILLQTLLPVKTFTTQKDTNCYTTAVICSKDLSCDIFVCLLQMQTINIEQTDSQTVGFKGFAILTNSLVL